MTGTTREVTPPGQDLSVWAERIAAAPHLTLDELAREQGWSDHARLLVLGAHPDDETLGCGRLVHSWSRRALATALTATAGEACVDHVADRPSGLADLRLDEWRRAVAVLGADVWPSPRIPDGQLGQHGPVLIAEIDRWLGLEDASDVVIAAPWRGDPHPGHRACGRAAASVAARWQLPLIEYPVWMTYWTDPAAAPDLPLIRLCCDPSADEVMRRARAEFTSQLRPLPPDSDPSFHQSCWRTTSSSS